MIRKAQKILELIDKNGDTKRDYQANSDFLVKSIVRDIQFKKQEISCVEAALKAVMPKLDYKLETMPGISAVTAAERVAEIGDTNASVSGQLTPSIVGHYGLALTPDSQFTLPHSTAATMH